MAISLQNQKQMCHVTCMQPEHKDEFLNMTVYHYTSPDAFRAIVEKRVLRFTDIRFLNDKSESIYFVEILAEFLEKKGKEYPVFNNCFERMLNGRKPHDISNVYDEAFLPEGISDKFFSSKQRCFVFSTSTQQDCLNMWNYYVNNDAYQGYNIGFQTGNLLNSFMSDLDDMFLDQVTVKYGRVVYRREEQFHMLETMVREMETKLTCFKPYGDDSEDTAALNQWLIQREIDAYAAFFKHPAFEAENEFRIALIIESGRLPQRDKTEKNHSENTKKIAEGFTTKRGLIVPYVQIALHSDSICSVTVAPIMEFELAKRGVSELMRGSKIGHVKIMHSEIPIRF